MQPGWNATCKDCTRAIAPQTPWRKPRRYAVSAHLLAQSLGSDSSRTPPAWPSRAPQGGAGTLPGNGGDGAERHEAGIGQRIEARSAGGARSLLAGRAGKAAEKSFGFAHG